MAIEKLPGRQMVTFWTPTLSWQIFDSHLPHDRLLPIPGPRIAANVLRFCVPVLTSPSNFARAETNLRELARLAKREGQADESPQWN
jgi:hypothetical protein